MDHSLVTFLAPGATLLIGLAGGFLLARVLPRWGTNRTQRQLDELQKRFDNYQNEVVNRFNTSAALVQRLTQSYQDVHKHLSESVARLAPDELIRQRVLVAQRQDSDDSALSSPEKRPTGTVAETPKDYAESSRGKAAVD